ncbi:Uma2 family endonuclease [Okeania sp. SIO3I5]|uniref:Uma2 family endonuclease n=1 Tax=Okeania sp. SIO3I5 TaxID=2607805 RepID=UPI0025FB46F6|nr:Uma2 family endonuclease [Okeania sp. SIO3I5]
MTVTIPINKIPLNPDSLITLNDLTWEQFEAFMEEKEAQRIKTRIAYIQGTLSIISPLPAHERLHRIISDIVKVLLDSQERDWEEFGLTTFRKRAKKI